MMTVVITLRLLVVTLLWTACYCACESGDCHPVAPPAILPRSRESTLRGKSAGTRKVQSSEPDIHSLFIESVRSSRVHIQSPLLYPGHDALWVHMEQVGTPSILPLPSPTSSPFQAPGFGNSLLPILITDIVLSSITYNQATGQLAAAAGTIAGLINGLPFLTNILNFLVQNTNTSSASTACAVLNLQLQPINLNVLGLHVDTSAICLEVTALPGGGLLGNLLCSLANGNLAQLGSLLDSLRDVLSLAMTQQMLLNSIFPSNRTGSGTGTGTGTGTGSGTGTGGVTGPLTTPVRPSVVPNNGTHNNGTNNNSVCTGVCPVLNLVIGPVDLTLLGLRLLLTDCNSSSVKLCLSATNSEGLLGQLLCGLGGSGLPLQIPGLGQ